LSNISNKVKELLLNLYLSPVNKSARLAMSVKNRILPEMQHLKGLTFTINHLTKGSYPAKLVLDIGCFNGNTSIFFNRELKDVKVIGFEPSKQSYQQALKNTNGIQGIKTCLGLGAACTTAVQALPIRKIADGKQGKK